MDALGKCTKTMNKMIVNRINQSITTTPITTGWVASVLTGAVFVGLGHSSAQGQAVQPPDNPKGWETSAAAGVTLTRGNSKSFLATAGVDSNRKWSKDEALLGASVGYGKTTAVNRTDGEEDPETKTAAYAKGFGQFNHLFTERAYGGVRLDGLHDDISDVYYRFTLSPLVGYYFIKKPATTLSADIGPSWIVEKIGAGPNDPDGEAGARGYLGVRLGERFEHKFANGARVWQTADVTPEVEQWENYVFNFEIGLDAPITKSLSSRVVLQDTYDHQPTPGRLKNDLKLIAGLAYKF
jgi:putative salt-induced outer membrane protein YdiY